MAFSFIFKRASSGMDANTRLFLPLDTDANDASGNNVTTNMTGHIISSAEKKFGAGSMLCDGGTSDVLTISPTDIGLSAATNTNDFTLDFQTYLTDRTSRQDFVNLWTSNNNFWRLYITATTLNIRFEVKVSGSTTVIMNASNTYLSTDTWHHMAIERYGNIFSMYIDGVQRATVTDTSPLYIDDNELIEVGRWRGNVGTWGTGAYNLLGYIDELRWSDVARYQGVASFTPPTEQY